MPIQTTLTDTDDNPETTDDTPLDDALHTSAKTSESVRYSTLAPADKRGGDGCCPWCLAATETFEHRDGGRVRCGHCDASIPINAEWYERGEKIVV